MSTKSSIIKKVPTILDGEQPRIQVFNKESGAHVGEVMSVEPDKLDRTYFKYKAVVYDAAKEVWEGDYETGKLIPIADKRNVVYERDMDIHAGAVIKESFPIHKQINVLGSLFEKLIDANAIEGEEVDAFREMTTFIAARRDANERFKAAYSMDPSFEYVTKRGEFEQIRDALGGGLHEKIGTRIEVMNGYNDADADVDA